MHLIGCPSTGINPVLGQVLSMLIYVEMRGVYDAKMVPYIIYKPTKFEKNPLKIKEIITNILTCVRVLVN